MKIAASWPERTKDECADFFGACLRACDPGIPATANVLEIGCCEYDWLTPAAAAWPEMTFTGLDWRGRKDAGKNPRITCVRGDVRVQEFPAESFDWIVSISAIEHVGLGNYDADPLDVDGDIKAVQRAWSWLKPGGWFYFDVPWNSGEDAYQVCGRSHRIYDDDAIEERFAASHISDVSHWYVAARTDTTALLTNPYPLTNGNFYYLGLWLRKPL